MNPNTVFSASLITSLVLWFPSMQACLRGDLDLTPAALRYLAALAVSTLAMQFLARLVTVYRAQATADQQPDADPSDDTSEAPTGLSRRRTDRHPDGDAADPGSLAA